MDTTTISVLAEMGTNLTTLLIKETATAVQSKIQSVKNEKNADTIRNTYNEIVNQLLAEREEAVRIAQAYKEELERVEISDEDIEHLHETVAAILKIIQGNTQGEGNEKIEKIEPLKELISIDTLKTMQLLGFNYKAAIGEPLTKLCADAIMGFGKSNNKKK